MSSEALIDIGCNLGHASFRSDRDAVIDRALAAGVREIVITGTSEASSREAVAIARSRPGVLFATAGVHPHNARTWNADVARAVSELAAKPEVVALGECGLDFNRDFSPRPAQERCFEAHLDIAKQTAKKPLFLHERDAHARFAAILREHRASFGAAVVHCFTGSSEELDVYLDLDLHIGITGWICDERRGQHLRSLLPRIPLARLMIETDAPFLVPRDMRPRPSRNEPAFLPRVLDAVATSLNLPPAEVARATRATARAFFSMPHSAPLSSPP
jgi:TatD DNase family protein